MKKIIISTIFVAIFALTFNVMAEKDNDNKGGNENNGGGQSEQNQSNNGNNGDNGNHGDGNNGDNGNHGDNNNDNNGDNGNHGDDNHGDDNYGDNGNHDDDDDNHGTSTPDSDHNDDGHNDEGHHNDDNNNHGTSTPDGDDNHGTSTPDVEGTSTPATTTPTVIFGGGAGSATLPTIQSTGASTGTPISAIATSSIDTATTCQNLFENYMKFGQKNKSDDVKRLQAFLNQELGLNLVIDGKFGKATLEAVKKFQAKYASTTLLPWDEAGISKNLVKRPNGRIYKTTLRQINLLLCPSTVIPMPELK